MNLLRNANMAFMRWHQHYTAYYVSISTVLLLHRGVEQQTTSDLSIVVGNKRKRYGVQGDDLFLQKEQEARMEGITHFNLEVR
jgi:hypothetical protein